MVYICNIDLKGFSIIKQEEYKVNHKKNTLIKHSFVGIYRLKKNFIGKFTYLKGLCLFINFNKFSKLNLSSS